MGRADPIDIGILIGRCMPAEVPGVEKSKANWELNLRRMRRHHACNEDTSEEKQSATRW